MTATYEAFVASKLTTVPPTGIANPMLDAGRLFPFQADIVRWALRRGRAAIFADCGLGKSICQLTWARAVCDHFGPEGKVLILAPLAVAKQTVREGEKFGIAAKYCRAQSEVQPGITVANYEMLHAFDPAAFDGVVLDESSILKAYDSKTRNAIITAFRNTPFRLACTATPAPNDFVELGNHTEFLGVMNRVEMLATYFVHDGGETQTWRLKGHAEQDFWRWVCSWAVMVRKPSDLGYEDGAFDLPPLHLHQHIIPASPSDAQRAGRLFIEQARTLTEQRAAKRVSLSSRVAECAALIASSREPWLVWCELNAESAALCEALPGAVEITGADSPAAKERRMLEFANGPTRVLVSKASICGFGLNFQRCSNVAFVGVSHSFEAFYQAVRRCWRFGQTNDVHCHVFASELEGAVVASLERKQRDATRMAEAMVANMRDVQRSEVRGAVRETIEYERRTAMTVPAWIGAE
jgi:superfamily II DNA or RNA helicase